MFREYIVWISGAYYFGKKRRQVSILLGGRDFCLVKVGVQRGRECRERMGSCIMNWIGLNVGISDTKGGVDRLRTRKTYGS